MIWALVEKGPLLTGCLNDPVHLGLRYIGLAAYAAFEQGKFPAPDLSGISIVGHGDGPGRTCIDTRTASDTCLRGLVVRGPRDLVISAVLHGNCAYAYHLFTDQGAQPACNTFIAIIIPFVLEKPWLINAAFFSKFSDYI